MTDILPLVLDTAKAYGKIRDDISPKLDRELRQAGLNMAETWETDEGIKVDDAFIFALLAGVTLTKVTTDFQKEQQDPTLALVAKMFLGNPSSGSDVATVTVGAMAYEYVLSVAPEALEGE